MNCSFDKLRALIGHSDFSVLGMLQNCAIFYALGDNISQINVSQIEGISNRCWGLQPMLYRQRNGYRLMVVQKMSIYTGDCKWDSSSSDYLKCLFERNLWRKTAVKPSSSDDIEVIGHAADLNTDILHVLYVDGMLRFRLAHL
ncbi:unnamed protein product [Gongylonema pulchrum]|uniref:Uncharacterized protein n=1 Tax=Gongylonema pulchrum TaxID=637853 RepID=A0A3P6PXA1_9BILA|nr:unnamed protein product [Gongylonema pulchrum]